MIFFFLVCLCVNLRVGRSELCLACSDRHKWNEPCGALTFKNENWCETGTLQNGSYIVAERCCHPDGKCCDVDVGGVFGIVLLFVFVTLGVLYYLGKQCETEMPICWYVDHAYDDLCASELCMSRKYKMRVGIEKQTHTGVTTSAKQVGPGA